MKTINQVTRTAVRTAGKAPAVQPKAAVQQMSADERAETAKLVNLLLDQLRSIYPAWKQAWTSGEQYQRTKKVWTEALIEARISDWALIERGLGRCRQEGVAFIPSVGQFISYCWPTPEELGMPSEEDAYREALYFSHPSMAGQEQWSHIGVFNAVFKVRRETLISQTSPEAARLRFAKSYHDVCIAICRGEQLVEPLVALPAEVSRKGDPATAKSALDTMRQMLTGKGA
jgi:hypothetical protein